MLEIMCCYLFPFFLIPPRITLCMWGREEAKGLTSAPTVVSFALIRNLKCVKEILALYINGVKIIQKDLKQSKFGRESQSSTEMRTLIFMLQEQWSYLIIINYSFFACYIHIFPFFEVP